MFNCDKIQNPEIRKKINRAKKIKSLSGDLLCLPNIHEKNGLESPPQFVASTHGTIVPQLTAPAMNCGMSIFLTTLTENDFSETFLTMLSKNLREEVAPRTSKTRAFLQWLGMAQHERKKYDLTVSQLEDVFQRGAEAAIDIYKLPKQELQNIEYGGRVTKGQIDLRNIIPRSTYTNGRHEMGYNFGGNHFLEIHKVEKIIDAKIAANWGLNEGQLVFFYHGGGGHATYHLGRYFANREKNTKMQKIILFVLKGIFHFFSRDGIYNFRARWKAYFSHKLFPEIHIDSAEGKRLWQSIQISLNYGYAFRVVLLKRINDALPKGKASFLWDAAHNSITREGDMVIHRQDAVRVFPGKPVMIAGSNNTLSYIGVGLETAKNSNWSATPSAGKTIAQYRNNGRSNPDYAHTSLVLKQKTSVLKRVDHCTSEGLDSVTKELEDAGIIKPIIYLRPLGSIKGH